MSFRARGLLAADCVASARDLRSALAGAGQVPDVVQTVVSGNVRPNALLKMRLTGVDAYLRPELGGYGSDHCRWPSLLGVVWEKARTRRNLAVDPGRTVVVAGSTEVAEGALELGATVIAVASGGLSGAVRAGPAAQVVPDLEAAADVLTRDALSVLLPAARGARRRR